MIELTNAVKNICLNPTKEDHELIFELQGRKWEIDSRLEELKLKIEHDTTAQLRDLKNKLNIALVNKGYETIDETLEVN